MYRYAQINQNGYVIADSHLSGVTSQQNMILIDDDFDLKNRRWNGADWETHVQIIPEPQLTETEQAILDTAINVDYLVCMKELEI